MYKDKGIRFMLSIFKSIKNRKLQLAFIAGLLAVPLAQAEQVTIFGGKAYGSDLTGNSEQKITVDSSNIVGFSYAWNNGPRGQGQIIVSRISHDFISNNNTQASFDITHVHFNGVAHFKQRNYITTVSLGVGGSQFKVESFGDEVRPSITAAIGTRYQLSNELSIVTELRSYMTLVDQDSELFCESSDNCLANFDDTFWSNTVLTLGLAYEF